VKESPARNYYCSPGNIRSNSFNIQMKPEVEELKRNCNFNLNKEKQKPVIELS